MAGWVEGRLGLPPPLSLSLSLSQHNMKYCRYWATHTPVPHIFKATVVTALIDAPLSIISYSIIMFILTFHAVMNDQAVQHLTFSFCPEAACPPHTRRFPGFDVLGAGSGRRLASSRHCLFRQCYDIDGGLTSSILKITIVLSQGLMTSQCRFNYIGGL